MLKDRSKEALHGVPWDDPNQSELMSENDQ